MAVVQISRIQVRRGRKRADTGMPQLASGELAWAIDTQELFIGNGSTGEGAPYVGNTKILTEHDSLLELANTYQYKLTDPTLITGTNIDPSDVNYLNEDANLPVRRTLQDRLDEGKVNAKSFGIIPLPYPVDSGETIETQTARFNNALKQLYVPVNPLEPNSFTNVTLEFDPGLYQFNGIIEVPSNASIVGSGKRKTTFEFLSTSVALRTQDSSRILMEKFTVKLPTNSTGLTANDITASIFKSIEFVYGDGVPVTGATENIIGINVTQDLVSSTLTSQNIFEDIEFHGLTYAVNSSGDSRYNLFKECIFRNLFQGVRLGTNPNAEAQYNSVVDSVFDTILEQAITINGYGNKSRGNTFVNVGNNNGGQEAVTSVIKFMSAGNSSSQDYFERNRILNDVSNVSLNYVPEIEGPVYREELNTLSITLPTTLTPLEGFRLPLSRFTNLEVDYIFNSTTFQQVRSGTLSIVVDQTTDSVQLVDDYEYTGPVGGENSIIFTAEIRTVTDKSIVINYINRNEPTDSNTFTYTYSIRV